jgi:MFS family permease
VIPAYVAIGVALGLTISAASTDALNAAEPAERGEASGITQMMRQVGGAIGLAVLGTVISGNMHPTVPTHHAINAALTSATADAFWVGAAVLLPVGLAAIALLRYHAPTDALIEAPASSPALEAVAA